MVRKGTLFRHKTWLEVAIYLNMTIERDKNILIAAKDSFIQLGQSAIDKGLLDYLFASAGISAAAVSTPISVPLIAGLFVAHATIKFFSNKSKKQEQEAINKEFQNRYKEICVVLAKNRETQITELSKVLDIKYDQKHLSTLLDQLAAKLNAQCTNLEDIYQIIDITSNDLFKFKDQVLNKLEDISKTTSCIDKKTDQCLDGISNNSADLKKIIKLLEENGHKNDISREGTSANLLNLIFNISPDNRISTGNVTLDEVVNIISQNIVQNNILEALASIERVLGSVEYKDSKLADIWLSALRGQALLIAWRKDEALSSLQHSEELLNKSSASIFLQLIYANGYAWAGRVGEALVIIDDIRKSDSQNTFPDATALWIRLCDISISEIEKQLSDKELTHHKVLEALAIKAMDEEQYDFALRYARESLALAQNTHRPPCYHIIADILFHKRFGGTVKLGFGDSNLSPNDWSDFNEVTDCYRLLLNTVEPYASDSLKARVICNLSLVYFLFNDYKTAQYYIDKISSITSPIDIDTLDLTLVVLCLMNKHSQALSLCEKFEKYILTIPRLMYRYASIMLDYGSEKRIYAYKLLEEYIANEQNHQSVFFIESSITLGIQYLHDNRISDFNELMKKMDAYPLQINILKAAQESGTDISLATHHIEEAMKYLPDDEYCRNNIILNSIPILKAGKNLELCLKMMDDIIPRDNVTNIGIEYLNIAFQANDYSRAAHLCQDLRAHGCYNWDIIVRELQLTLRTSNIETERLVNNLLPVPNLKTYQEHLYVWLALAQYGMGTLGRTSDCFSIYPGVPQLDHWFPYINIPLLLKATGQGEKAIEYAYLLSQKFPDQREIKRIYFTIFLEVDNQCSFQKFDKVSVNCAVTYTKNKSRESFTVVIDDSPFHSESRNEYSPQHKLSRELMDKHIGDEFPIGGIGGQVGKISAIENKYVFYFHKFMMEESNQAFDQTVVMIETPDDSNGQMDLSPLIDQLSSSNKRRIEMISKAVKIYKETISSIYFFSRCSGLSLAHTLEYFFQQNDLYIYADGGTSVERDQCYKILDSKLGIVISPLTVKILIFMHAYFDLDVFLALNKSGFKFFVSEYLISELKQEQDTEPSPNMLYLLDGQPTIITNDVKNKKYHKSLLACVAFLETVEVIPGSVAINDFEDSQRDISSCVDRSLYHSLRIASVNDKILWDDDLNIINFYNDQDRAINVKERVFSQAMFFYLTRSGVVAPDDVIRANIFFLASNEYFCSFNAATVCEIFIHERKYPGLQSRLLKYIDSKNTESHSTILIISIALTIIWEQSYNLMAISLIVDSLCRRSRIDAKIIINTLLKRTSLDPMAPLLHVFINRHYGVLFK